MLKKLMYGTLVVSLFTVIQGCSSQGSDVEHSQPISIAANARVVVLPFYNTTNDAGAGAKAAIITASLLRADNIDVANVPYMDHKKISQDMYKNIMTHCEWARDHNISYIMKGSVNEWGYVSNPDGNLAVAGMSLQLRETTNCTTVWNAVGSKTTHAQMSVTGAAQKLISHMLRSLRIQ